MSDAGKGRQLLSQTVIYGIGIMLNRSVSFVLLPVYTKYFTPQELGMFTLVQSVSIFLGFVYALGLETAFMKKFIDAGNDSDKKKIYSSAIFFLLLSSAVFSAILCYSAPGISHFLRFENQDAGTFLIRVMSAVMIADTVYRIPMLLFRARLQSTTYSLLNLLSFLINISLNLIFIAALGMGVEAIFYSYVISAGVVFAVSLILTRDLVTPVIDLTKTKELLAYGFKFIFIGVFILVIEISDRFFLQFYFGEAEVGIYSAGYRLASVMGLVISAFRFAWTPFFLNLNAESASKEVITVVTNNFFYIGCAMFLTFSLFTGLIAPEKIFGISFIDERYIQGISVVPVLMAAYFFSGLYSAFNAAPFFTDNTRSLLYISGAGVILNLVLNVLLIPEFEMRGAAWATLITYLFMFAVIVVYSQRIYRLELSTGRIVIVSVICFVLFAMGHSIINRSEMHLSYKLIADGILVLIFLYSLRTAGAFRKL